MILVEPTFGYHLEERVDKKTILRFPAFASLCFSLLALPVVTGCSGDSTELESAEAAVSAPTQSSGTFIVIESTDKIVATLGVENNTLETEASRAYGIGAIGAYILEKKGGESFGVITAYDRDTGAARIEFVTNLKTKETGIAMAEELRSSLDEASLEALLDALKIDLQDVEQIAVASVQHSAGDVQTAGWWPWSRDDGEKPTGTWCGTRAIASLVSGVLGSAAFVTGAQHALLSGLLLSFPAAGTAGVTATFLGGALGVVGGVVLVGIGVVTLAYTTYGCATE